MYYLNGDENLMTQGFPSRQTFCMGQGKFNYAVTKTVLKKNRIKKRNAYCIQTPFAHFIIALDQEQN
jgi:hypothetical protein